MIGITRSLCTLAAVIASALPLRAYGPIGHQIVGAVADARLAKTPAAAKVSALLDGITLEKASVIPDEIKGWDKKGADDPGIFHYSSHPQIDAQLRDFWRANQPTHDPTSAMPSHHWFHYTDVPVLDPEKYADGKAGRTQWDIVQMMRFCIAVLTGEQPEGNPRKITKAVAVILLAHYVGDIHQPLHVGAEYFTQNGQPVNPDRLPRASGIASPSIFQTAGVTSASAPSPTVPAALEDQGGNSLILQLAVAQQITGNRHSKLHGFWDNDAVLANFPALPETMPKEERRAKTDEARAALVRRYATDEPKNWRAFSGTPAAALPEAWANEILPIAREAHARLRFEHVHPQPQDDGGVIAAGDAIELPAVDHAAYRDWSGGIVGDELHKAGWRLADLLQQIVK